MKYSKYMLLICMIFIFCIELFGASINTNEIGCTIGVASGKATSNGRPLLWKTRDSSMDNNAVYYENSMKYKFIAVVTPGYLEYCWMGVNEKGFSIINAYAPDLPGTSEDNCLFMRDAVGTCATISQFQALLDSTNFTGRRTQSNYGVIDSTGAAAIFETGNKLYWKFDANNTAVAPEGYIIRTNFSVNGGGEEGIERYDRSAKLIKDFNSGDSLNYKSILRYQMRDFSDNFSAPLSVPYKAKLFPETPYGYICTSLSICRNSSVSASVVQGVLPGESAKLSTMWTIIGQPATTIAIPYWPVGYTPIASYNSTISSLCDLAIKLRQELFEVFYVSQIQGYCDFIDTYKLRDENGSGLWSRTFTAEDSIFLATEKLLNKWRGETLDVNKMLDAENTFADYSLSIIQQVFDNLTTIESAEALIANNFVLYQNYPNPFNPTTTIEFDLPKTSNVTLKIFNILGEEVVTLVSDRLSAGSYSYEWSRSVWPPDRPAGMASGVYLYKLEADNYVETKKMILIR